MRVVGRLCPWLGVMALASCTDPVTVTCGEGTLLRDGVCIGTGGLACGPGTHEAGDLCVPDDGTTYELRVFSPQIAADGHTKTPVLVIGTRSDGTPATERVVLNTDRAGAGTFVDASPTLGPLGATTYYVPCNATTAGCTGPVRLTLALAGDPGTVVARIDARLVEPTGVASAAPCMVASRAMFLDGGDAVFRGTMTVTQGAWAGVGASHELSIRVMPSQLEQGLWWSFAFDTRQLGAPLVPGVYEQAQRATAAAPDHPGIEVIGEGRSCGTITGRFQVHAFELQPDATTVKRALVSFEQRCDGGLAMLAGCVRYEL